ncbi:hypothetical protein EP073_07500 [Geovibrio thiophilus]|uniref:Uncharacterized protein n=1 Tax=Geovibrio thiophilus TaxID=139438 RepID=A0A3R5UUX0_9BACT|nr:hypothetical protein [Geovibrio thiophilus]QAR33251.1 hypothetical protein EP073_07500 [Geovibrio thiophilus]
MINADNSIVNLRERLLEADKRKSQSVQTEKSSSVSSTPVSQGQQSSIADIIEIRNENKLAAVGPVRTEEDARDIVTMLKSKFTTESKESINAHRKASAETVMGFYPFE